LIGSTLAEHFDRVVAEFGPADALVSCSQGIRLSYNQLKQAVDNFASGLMQLGADAGDRVGIWSANSVKWVICQLATAKIGAILVNINPAYKLAELEYALKQSGVKILVFSRGHKADEYISMLEELAPGHFDHSCRTPKRLPDLEHLVLIGPGLEGTDV